MADKKIKIAFLAAEAAPFAKVGGLADVVGSLPKALADLNCDVRIIMPLYGCINRRKYKIRKLAGGINVCAGGHDRKINVWTAQLPGSRVNVYFIEEPHYFGRREIYLAGGNSERFLFFSLACLYALPHIGFSPDILHCHDFHAAMAIGLAKSRQINYLKRTKAVYTIHNLNFQGRTEIKTLANGGLTEKSLPSLAFDAQDGDINFMVQGIINADAVTTVSPTYAEEIQTTAYSEGLERVIKKNKKKITGIINGIDYDYFNPARDRLIKQRYGQNSLDKKTANKLYLQKRLGLPIARDKAAVGFISRLTRQKGVELIAEQLAADASAQFFILGAGAPEYENRLKKLAAKFPRRISLNLKFDSGLAQAIYAGADILLIPSLFEPCGLTQMIAMRYGTVPVVRAVGGLADTVMNYQGQALAKNKTDKAKKAEEKILPNGFAFKKYDAGALIKTLNRALKIYYERPRLWRQLQINGMNQDFSWRKPALKYLKLYRRLVK